MEVCRQKNFSSSPMQRRAALGISVSRKSGRLWLASGDADSARKQVEAIPITLANAFQRADVERISTSEAVGRLARQALEDR